MFSMTAVSSPSKNVLAIILIALCGLYIFRWVFYPEMTFFMDDWSWLTTAIFVDWKSFLSIWTILPASLFHDRPIEAVIIKVLYQTFGLNYRGYGAAVLTLHVANATLLYFLASRLLSSRFYGMIAAILFVVDMNVAYPAWWVSTVADSACLFFCLCTFLSFLSGRAYSAFLTVLFYCLAVKSKEAAIPFPLILFAQSFLAHTTSIKISELRKSALRALRATWPIIAAFIAVLSFSMYYFAMEKIHAVDFGPYAPKFDVATVLDGLRIYLRYIASNLLSPEQALQCFVVLTIIAVLSWTRVAMLGSVGFIIASAPVLVLATQRAPYYAYIPSPFIALLLVALVQRGGNWLASQLGRETKYVFKGAVLVAILWFTHYIYAIGFYRDSELADMRENSKALASLESALTQVADKSNIVITGLPPKLNLFTHAPCTVIRVVFKIWQIDCRIEGTTAELLTTYQKLAAPKILLHYDTGDVSLVERSP